MMTHDFVQLLTWLVCERIGRFWIDHDDCHGSAGTKWQDEFCVSHFILLHIEAFFLAGSSQQRYLHFSISIRSMQKCCLNGLTCHKEDSVLASRQHISTASACKTYFERWSSAPPRNLPSLHPHIQLYQLFISHHLHTLLSYKFISIKILFIG